MKNLLKYLFVFVFVFTLSNCNSKSSSTLKQGKAYVERTIGKRLHITALEQTCINNGLIDVTKLDSTIIVKMAYATDSNFMHVDMYGDFDKAYLQKAIAEKLVLANKSLKQQKPGYTIIVYDAARPLAVQQLMWNSLSGPDYEKEKFVANPAKGSLHNFGCAVDLSIVDDKGNVLDMGTPYDFSGELAYPIYEEKFLKSGKLTQQQYDNRKLLYTVMKKAGFSPIDSEWWHFMGSSLEKAKAKYKIIS